MIVIAPYDARWPGEFEAEAQRIGDVFGSAALRIDHVGSTSVPGLAAKPVIDIQISLGSLEPREIYDAWLQKLGYAHFPLGDFDRVYPFFKRPETWPSSHHVHLCVSGSEQERDHLAFRDCLRRDPKAAAEYERLKRSLAAEHHGKTMESQECYSLAKSEFVKSILRGAISAT
jgi:GrpB-like predicted nucleotidyltransferase (UPF0157 family)